MHCAGHLPANRREFLLSAGVFAAGALMNVSARAHSQPEAAQGNEPAPQQAKPQPATPEITSLTIATASAIAGIQFTETECQMMAETIGEQVARFAKRRTRGYLPNSHAPALRFDPRLPGMSFPRTQRAIIRSKADSDPLPADDEAIAYAPVSKFSRWIERSELTSQRLTRIYLDRLKAIDPKLKCVITLTEELALQQAAQADAEIANRRYRGPLHGIPYGVKDLFDTANIPTTWGAEPYRQRVPQHDATVITKLREAGAVLVAKLSLGALAYNDIWFGGRTNNPWNLQQGSSGSSAGSAAATAAGLVGFSLGTETFGSIVSPSMRCGTTGLRPTFGRVSRNGAMALCWSLDKVGPICRTVEDCALVLAAINGADDADPFSINMPLDFDVRRPLNDIRIGYDPAWFEGNAANDLDRQALNAARELGLQLVEIKLPDWPYDVLLSILLAEAAAAFEELTRENLDDTLTWQDPIAWPNTFRQAWFIPAIEMVQADRFRRQCMRMMAEQFANVDAIIGPSFAGSLCLITNYTGHPSLTLRCGFRKHDPDVPNSPEVPHGITLIGRLFDEGTICRVGMALERKLNVWHRRPPLT